MAITTVHNELIAVNAISGTLIADNAITATHIATNAVSGVIVADNAITTVHIAENNVTSTSIVANAITSTQLADNAVIANKIPDGTIATVHLTDVNVTTGKIANDAVTLAKMAGITRGSIIIGNSGGDPAALAIGSNDYVLTSDGTDIAWEAAGGGGATLSGSTNNTVVTVTGSNAMIGESTLTYDGLHLGMTSNHADHPSDANVIQLGGNAAIQGKTATGAGKSFRIMQNVYDDAAAGLSYISTDEASHYTQVNGTHSFNVATSGSADAAITFTEAMHINSSGKVWAAGHVLQVVTATGGAEEMGSGTMNSTGLYASITPAATSSKILAMAVSSGTYNNGTAGLKFGISRGTSGEGSGSVLWTGEIKGSDTPAKHFAASILILDSPSSTASNTYTVMHASTNGSTLVGWVGLGADGSDVGHLVLMEIGA